MENAKLQITVRWVISLAISLTFFPVHLATASGVQAEILPALYEIP